MGSSEQALNKKYYRILLGGMIVLPAIALIYLFFWNSSGSKKNDDPKANSDAAGKAKNGTGVGESTASDANKSNGRALGTSSSTPTEASGRK